MKSKQKIGARGTPIFVGDIESIFLTKLASYCFVRAKPKSA